MSFPEAEAKRALRATMRERLRALSRAERERDSARICERLREGFAEGEVRVVLGFVALPSEPDVGAALRAWGRAGVEVCLPRWRPREGDYEAAVVGEESSLCVGPYGVREPGPDAPAVSWERLDLVLVPGLAFDPSGRRLGRGKGYFDRLLSFARRARRWGVAFDFQIVAEVPAEPHDVNVHQLVTPGAWLRVLPCNAV